jgi:hypothetical protein
LSGIYSASSSWLSASVGSTCCASRAAEAGLIERL